MRNKAARLTAYGFSIIARATGFSLIEVVMVVAVAGGVDDRVVRPRAARVLQRHRRQPADVGR